MMRFLICGLGSIGQRHIRMIRSVLGDEAEIAAYRSRNIDIVINDKLEASFGTKPEDHYKLKTFSNFKEALDWNPDAVFVTNPISMHVSTALEAAKAGSNVFIEKPLGHDVSGLEELSKIVRDNGVVCMVGYQLRYHPALIKIKSLLAEESIGNLISADLHFGEWLPGMHPYEDYQESHAARSDQGGGVILCLSHEIDTAYWLFGKPSKVYAQGGHLSDLEMDVEDVADILLTVEQNDHMFPVHIHLDFLQKPARRYCHIVGEKGSIFWDYFQNEVRLNLLPDGHQEKWDYSDFKRNDMFVSEVAEFIDSIIHKKTPPIPLNEGVDVLEICMAAKESLASGKAEIVK
jgi:predicted dehydrogenase